MSKIRLLFFATLRERAGTKTAEMEILQGTTLLQLKERIAQEYPGLAPSLASALIAVNREYAADDLVIPDDADVALFPPVSGG
jgi:molybdopterin converting factor subunit 1